MGLTAGNPSTDASLDVPRVSKHMLSTESALWKISHVVQARWSQELVSSQYLFTGSGARAGTLRGLSLSVRLEVCRSLEEWCLLRSLSCDLSLCSRFELFLSRSLSLSLSLSLPRSLSLSLSLCLSLSLLSCFSRLCLLSSLCPFSSLLSNCFSRYAYLRAFFYD